MDAKNSEWIEKTEAKIREAFDLFDKEKADAIIQVLAFFFSSLLIEKYNIP
jgi:hypothetical protein